MKNMKKICVLMLTMSLTLALAACKQNPAPDRDPVETDPVVTDDIQEPEKTIWDEILGDSGSVINESAYMMSQDEYRERAGEPDVSQVTYYGDFQADIYYDGLDVEDFNANTARVIELDFELTGLSGESRPAMIRLTELDGASLSDDSVVLSTGTLGMTKLFRGMALDDMIADSGWGLGEPALADTGAWGFATWYEGRNEISAYLDADGRILYFQARSTMDDALNAQDGLSTSIESEIMFETGVSDEID